ncbi:DNA polymerase beta superfamily protein [Chitinophaga rhizosphaerae]|uniref:DNA polymerase beta superfamily protein n=1 Tax=Chitinophaga rhizosphaerae TaxID=1864947 RepID=UPI000F7FE402|nr:nucleotidyltransferase domain-containing protein [Chitinophaga rhizosphaerae]
MIDIAYLKANGLVLFEALSGSRAYGLATPSSDTDMKGVFYLPRHLFFSGEYVPQVANASNDAVYYELGRFVELLCKNNPNMLELLCTPASAVNFRHPLMDAFPKEMFFSKLAEETFAGYAWSQIGKAKGLNKKINNPEPETRKTVIDCCYVTAGGKTVALAAWLRATRRRAEFCGLTAMPHTKGLYALYYDENAGYRGIVSSADSDDVHGSPVAKGTTPEAYLFFNQEAYSAHCRSYAAYWKWVSERNEARFTGNQAHGKGFDAKNMMHTTRLLRMAHELFTEGELPVWRHDREELLAIKRGERDYDELLREAEALMATIASAARKSPLPDKPDTDAARKALAAVREKLYYPAVL